jgi:DNA-binding LytR/AlgR family response regulator
MTFSILICDDLPEERENLFWMLRTYEKAHGVELDIETAADGAEVLARWKPERWDMIFLDIFMPQLNGVEAARQLRKHDNVCEIVFATTSRAHGNRG